MFVCLFIILVFLLSPCSFSHILVLVCMCLYPCLLYVYVSVSACLSVYLYVSICIWLTVSHCPLPLLLQQYISLSPVSPSPMCLSSTLSHFLYPVLFFISLSLPFILPLSIFSLAISPPYQAPLSLSIYICHSLSPSLPLSLHLSSGYTSSTWHAGVLKMCTSIGTSNVTGLGGPQTLSSQDAYTVPWVSNLTELPQNYMSAFLMTFETACSAH